MLKVGITGGIGSGKSLVAKLFSLLQIPIYDSDKRAKWLIEHDIQIVTEIKDLLGEESYLENRSYNKAFVSQKVFNDNVLLKKLNQIVHPRVRKDFEDWCAMQQTSFVIKEAAIMDKNSGLDKIIFVDSPTELRTKRILSRDPHRDLSQIKNVINNQKSDEEFRVLSDFVVVNDEKTLLIPQVLEIYQQLMVIS
jgi:dephospho-CoA kinase